MNVYFHIDPSWSYQFLTRHKKIIANYDFFTFSDRFLTVGINVLMAHANFQLTNNASQFSTAMDQVTRLCDDYPMLGQYIPAAFEQLRRIHHDALNAIQRPILNYQPVIDDMYILTGIVFTLVI
ncbi:hypothetical protein ST201phi2-1p165 [Pseudomonas phage 201phi2-1]|uniref:Uncharacterized protein n=1 Tax=Pseudomonas phage 201phi2-1 TaxID=198110 RepID=B3FJ28_BP201|nr:hypothetical protein ST201phi2-1p165 [Pseudomonas phage 201phi2-1]ABY62995.1 hypothetical protein 201phi2-1p165 [Pseudomonas phage 201phi2-1]